MSEKRWDGSVVSVENDRIVSGNECRPRPNLMGYENVGPGPSNEGVTCSSPFVEETVDSEDETPAKSSRPTGFELVASYSTPAKTYDDAPTYCLVDVASLSKFLESLPCKYCLDINPKITVSKIFGFAQQISVHCNSCNETNSFQTSQRINHNDNKSKRKNPFDVNRRIVKTFASIGKGHMAIETFSMCMNMPCLQQSAFGKHVKALVDVSKQCAEECLKNARVEVEKAYSEIEHTFDNAKPINIGVSYDGSWQKRGFTSKYGVGCVIEVITGLVIDYVVLSKYCRVCQKKKTEVDENSPQFKIWFDGHKPVCQANYEGSSPAMETEAAEILWKRSESLGFRYVSVISDGDLKSFDHVSALNVYGDDITIEKQECVNHVAKRLGKGLRNLVQDCKKAEVTLGGKKHGSLKVQTIDKLSQYYRNAIINNLDDTGKMRTAIYATLDHCRSTDDKPYHDKCPSGCDSWCFYQRDLHNNVAPKKHSEVIKTPINEKVYKHMLPIYKRLSDEQLLKRCSLGKTQNANESLHSVIWSKCPKVTFSARRRLEAAVGEAISVYNEGYLITMANILEKAGVSPGLNTSRYAQKKDSHRLRLRKAREDGKYKEYRRRVKAAQVAEEEKRIAEEGTMYGAGEF